MDLKIKGCIVGSIAIISALIAAFIAGFSGTSITVFILMLIFIAMRDKYFEIRKQESDETLDERGE